MVMLRSDPGNFDVGPSLLCVNFGDGRVAALIWIMPFWPRTKSRRRAGGCSKLQFFFVRCAVATSFVSRRGCTSGQVDDAIEPCGEC